MAINVSHDRTGKRTAFDVFTISQNPPDIHPAGQVYFHDQGTFENYVEARNYAKKELKGSIWIVVETVRTLRASSPEHTKWIAAQHAREIEPNHRKIADRIDGYDRDDLGESPDC
jgi:hypothetical protein